MKPITLIIADDHKIFLEGISSILKGVKDIKVITTETSAEGVLSFLKKQSVDIVISDISMPGMDGIALAEEIKKNYPDIKILALTMHKEGAIIQSMIKSGISGCVLKDAGKDELLNAIKTVHSGRTYFNEQVQSALIKSMMQAKEEGIPEEPVQLSDREKEILKLIAQELTQEQIAEKLFISVHTVIFHRRKLLDKFNAKNTAGLIMMGMKMGILK